MSGLSGVVGPLYMGLNRLILGHSMAIAKDSQATPEDSQGGGLESSGARAKTEASMGTMGRLPGVHP